MKPGDWDTIVCGWFIDELPDGRGIWVVPFLYTHAIIIGQQGVGYYDDRWCYATRELAIVAAVVWDPATEAEPTGWHRHPSSGRRRAGGDPALEVIAQ